MRTRSAQFSPKTGARPAVTPLPGSLHAEWVRCGKAGCRCAAGQRHGPYWWRHVMERGRKRRVYVRRADVARVRAGIALWHLRHPSLRAMLRELRALS